MIRKISLPTTVAILFGIISGCCSSIPQLLEKRYVQHRLYTTGARMLVHALDTYTFWGAVVCYAIAILVVVRRRVPNVAKWIYDLASAVLVIFATYHFVLSGFLREHPEVDLRMVMGLLTGSGLPLAGSAVIVLAGLLLMRRLRSRRINGKSSQELSEERSVLDTETRSARMMSAARCRAVIGVISVFVFLTINLAGAILTFANAISIRQKPNVIFVMVDTLRADHVGCYGYHRNTTPNIDALAMHGMKFNRAISQASWTTASVTSFMTSTYQRFDVGGHLPDSTLRMPEALKDNGYATGAVISNFLAGSRYCLAEGYDQFDESQIDAHPSSPGVESIAERMIAKYGDKRFFLFVHFMDCHTPYMLHEPYNFYPDYSGKLLGKKIESLHVKEAASGSDEDMKYVVALYDSGVALVDEHVGRLVNYLKRENLYDNSIIVFLADHGEEFGEHKFYEHGKTLYDTAISVPLIIKMPGEQDGRVIQGDFPLIDLFPSVMGYLGIDTSAYGLQGKDVHLAGVRGIRSTPIYSFTDLANVGLGAVRNGDYKFILGFKSGNEELYNVRHDSLEKLNVCKKHSTETAHLRTMLRDEDTRLEAAGLTFRVPHVSGGEKQKLRSLGYLQ